MQAGNLENIERLGEEAWAGVAAVDRGEEDLSLGRLALLAGGDAAALLLFAAIGRANHGESLDPASVLSVAWPFLAGWFGSAALLGGFGKEAQGGRTGPAAITAAKCWAGGLTVGIALRSLSRGYFPDKGFVIVTFAVTAVFLIGWRTALASITPEVDVNPSAASQAKRRRDKKGNPLEFLQLLTSLTKRW
ncbi:hypothetical protein WJX75_006698 [Coccomyxa subellipsoidea]|uniref:DUF3054 domain-containing protein n=1 Tax=Coccomyxa subellipsoidea TaxID=248742 RepID=A0ABR2YJU2_9CHLO